MRRCMRICRYFRISFNFSKRPKLPRVDQNALFKNKVIIMLIIALFLKRAFWSTLVNLGGFEKLSEIRKCRRNRIERRHLSRAPRRARGFPPYQTQGGPKIERRPDNRPPRTHPPPPAAARGRRPVFPRASSRTGPTEPNRPDPTRRTSRGARRNPEESGGICGFQR